MVFWYFRHNLSKEEINKVGQIEQKNPLEKLENDPSTCVNYIKFLVVAIRYYISSTCNKIVKHPLFEAISLGVILANCITLSMDDPTSNKQEDWQITVDYVFQSLYSAELVIKVLAMGFLFNSGAYLRDFWNIMDFIIVLFGYMEYLNLGNGGFDLKTLRLFRVLRPLRTVTSVEGLRILMSALVSSLPMLFDAVVVLMFFLIVFAIAGLQLWHGLLRFRCKNIETGIFDEELICGSATCPDGYECANSGANPNYGVTNFDDIFSSLFVVFTAVTQEGWASTQQMVIKAYGYTSAIFFALLILIGSYFLFNFTLAVIKSKVSSLYEQNRNAKKNSSKVDPENPPLARAKHLNTQGARKKIPLHGGSGLLPAFGKWDTDEGKEFDRLKKMIGIDEMEETDIKIERKKEPEICLSPEKSNKNIMVIDNNNKEPSDFRDMLKPMPMFQSGHSNLASTQQKVNEIANRLFDEISHSSDRNNASSERKNDIEEFEDDLSPKKAFEEIKDENPVINEPKHELIIRPEGHETSERSMNDEEKLLKIQTRFKPSDFLRRLSLKPRISITPGNENEQIENSPKENEHLESEVEEEEEVKFVLTDASGITLTSDTDVLLKLKNTKSLSEQFKVISEEQPPYKKKMLYEPTKLPEPEPDVPEQEEKEEIVEEKNPTEELQNIEGTSHPADAMSPRSDTVKSPVTPANKAKMKSLYLLNKKRRATAKNTALIASLKSDSNSEQNSPMTPKLANIIPAETPKDAPNSSSEIPREITQTIKDNEENKEKPKENDEESEEKKKSILEDFQKMKLDIKENSNKSIQKWSGQEVIENYDPYVAIWATGNQSQIRIWKKGIKGGIEKIRHLVKDIILSEITGGFLVLCVLANTVILAMTRYGQPASEVSICYTLNTTFTSIFIAEMTLKLFSMGIVKYLSDPINYVDGLVVVISIVEIIFLDSSDGGSVFRAFQAFRILRTLRVVRMVRLLRSLRSMRLLIQVISDTLMSFAYIGMLLVVFLFIYSLLGMQLFGGKFDFPEGQPRQNFDSFHSAFLSVYQVLTIENWQDLQYASMRAQIPALVALFYVSWLFIGNYVLLNLFIALLLDAFAEEEDNDSKEDSSNASESKSVISDKSSKKKSELGTIVSEAKSKNSTKTLNKTIEEGEKTVREKKVKKVKKPPLWDTQCAYSLYLFSKENQFRIICWKVVTSWYFECVILILIGFSSLLLTMNTYFLESPDPTFTEYSDAINTFFITCFSLEAVIKILAYGFVLAEGTYLQDYWNMLDFFIVCASAVDFFVTSIDIPMIRILRLLRTLRPLRFLSHNQHMKIIVKALFRSFGALCNTMILILVVFLMFSIVGVSFFAGKFQYCELSKYEYSDKAACEANNGEWKTYDLNFDNVINGLLYLFTLTTQENWPISIYQAIDSTDIEKGPIKNNAWYYAYFFVIFIFVGSMFMLNLFVGVMSYNFTKVQKQEVGSFGGALADEQQLNWIEVQKMIIKAEPNYNIRTAPEKDSWRRFAHSIVTNFYFEAFVALIIILNMLTMAMYYENASETYLQVLEIINYVFTGIFTIEVILKLIGFGSSFWYEPWNIFDFIVVLSSYTDIIFSNIAGQSLRILRIGPQLLRVLRVLRIARLLRLVRKYQRLQAIMEIIQLCLPSIMNVFALLALILFIFSILGCYLFYDVTDGNAISSERNFSNFGMAIKLCLEISTGEDWNTIMYDCARDKGNCVAGIGCGKWYSYAYFISLKIIVTFVMLNLFVLVVLQLFEKYFISDENIMSTFKEDFDIFQEKWLEAKPSHLGFFIHESKLMKLFWSLPPKFGFEADNPNLLAKRIMDLDIRRDNGGNVFFNEVLYCTVHPLYTKGMIEDAFTKRKEKEAKKLLIKAAEREGKRAYYEVSRVFFFDFLFFYIERLY